MHVHCIALLSDTCVAIMHSMNTPCISSMTKPSDVASRLPQLLEGFLKNMRYSAFTRWANIMLHKFTKHVDTQPMHFSCIHMILLGQSRKTCIKHQPDTCVLANCANQCKPMQQRVFRPHTSPSPRTGAGSGGLALPVGLHLARSLPLAVHPDHPVLIVDFLRGRNQLINHMVPSNTGQYSIAICIPRLQAKPVYVESLQCRRSSFLPHHHTTSLVVSVVAAGGGSGGGCWFTATTCSCR